MTDEATPQQPPPPPVHRVSRASSSSLSPPRTPARSNAELDNDASNARKRGAHWVKSVGTFWKRLCACSCFCRRRKYTAQSNGSRALNASGLHQSIASGWNDMGDRHQHKTAEQLLAEKALKKQIAYYSTMRVHMKRVQLSLEQEKRNKFYKELLVYLVFLIVIMIALLSLPIHFPYEQNAAITDLFFDEEFPNVSIKKTFDDVMIEDELWQWVEGPLLAGYYDLPIRNNRRIGSIMVRSGRVKGELCRYTQGRNDFVLFDNEMCYPEFSSHAERKDPYGNASSVLQQQYTWKNHLSLLVRSQTFNPSLFNHQMDYGHGGYVVYLPRDNATAAEAIVTQLKEDFITDGARYLVANYAFYNPRSSIFTYVQALFEMSDTDYMETTSRVKSFRILSSYKDSWDFLQDNIFVLVLCLATIWLIFRELTDLREHGFNKYVHSLWNLLDMFQLVLLIIFIVNWVTYLVESENIREHLHRVVLMDCSSGPSDQQTAEDCYVDIEPLAWRFGTITNFAAALALVSVAIIFKYLRLNSRLNLLWRTLRFAAKDLLAFVVIFFTMFVGFAIMGFLTFGSSTRQYHSISVSLTSCFQMLLGAFDYNQIYNANPAMAGIFFFSFMISIYLICVNMFIAIMSEYYSLAQSEKKSHEDSKRNFLATSAAGGNGKDSDEFADSLQFADVEYDLAKQVKNYIRGQRVHVKLPPKKGASSAYATEQLSLCGYQRVLLVDYQYLMAERKRLRAKFRACVHVVTTVLGIMRKTNPDSTFDVTHTHIPDTRPRAASTAYSENGEDLIELPVAYLPIASVSANTVEILKRMRPGMHIEMDDGSLTKDQITLEVLGGQDVYLPPHFSRAYTVGNNNTNDNDLTVRISEATNTGDLYDDEKKFGLRHHHDDLGGPGHIRCCRVLYNGETVLNGMETCMLPRRTWVQYFMGHVFWGHLRNLFSFGKKKKKKANRLVTDAEVDKLIKESFAAPGRGISCRFDELVRNFRMFIAKKVHKRNMRIHNMEDRIFMEVITFLERFPSAVTPLDKRELEGYKYTPAPVDTKRVRLPNSINMLSELLSQNAHEVWAEGRIQQGWRWGPQRNNDTLLHPDLVPYEDLTEEDKQYDRDTSMSTLKVITALGYILEPPSTSEEIDIEFGEPAVEEGGTYEPKPIPTNDVKVPGYLRSVIELLAENTHEVWAKMRMEQGWKYGPRRDDDKREHNGLVPYMYLTQEEKQMDRNTAMQTVKVILRCGFSFIHKDLKAAAYRSKKKSSSHISVFGRSENVESKHVGDAVALARGTARAKRAFMKKNNSTRAFTNRTSSVSSLQSSPSFDSTGTGASAFPPNTGSGSQSLYSYGSSSSFADTDAPLSATIETSESSGSSRSTSEAETINEVLSAPLADVEEHKSNA